MGGKLSVAGIFERDGKYFIGQRLPGGDLSHKWEFPGGKIEGSETPQLTLVREFLEEFDVTITVGQFICETDFFHHDSMYHLLAYRVEFDSDAISLHEHVQTRWASIEEINELDFAESDKKILAHLDNNHELSIPNKN